MKQKSLVYSVTKIVVDIVFILGIISCFLVPYFVKWWGELMKYSNFSQLSLNVIIISSGLVALYIVWQLKLILKEVLEDNPFNMRTINYLRKIALSTLIISIIYTLKLILYFTLGTLVIVVVFLIATLLFLTLKDLFKRALYYKEENDGVI